MASLLSPSLWGFLAILVGLALLAHPRTRAAGTRTLAAGAAWLFLLGLGLPFDPIGRALEQRHPPIADERVLAQLEQVEWVVVLGGGHQASRHRPVSAHLPEAATYRLLEGIRLHHARPGSRLLLLGYGGDGRPAAADVAAHLARALGTDPDAITTDGSPRTTAEEAAATRELLGDGRGPILLVTSAVHMPRAVRHFERAGVRVIPAPTGHAHRPRHSPRDWLLPDVRRLAFADATTRELAANALQR